MEYDIGNVEINQSSEIRDDLALLFIRAASVTQNDICEGKRNKILRIYHTVMEMLPTIECIKFIELHVPWIHRDIILQFSLNIE